MTSHRTPKVTLVGILGEVRIWSLHSEPLVFLSDYQADVANAVVLAVRKSIGREELPRKDVVAITSVCPAGITLDGDRLTIGDVARTVANQETVKGR